MSKCAHTDNLDPSSSRKRTATHKIRLPRAPARRGTSTFSKHTPHSHSHSANEERPQASIDATGSPLTDEALAAAKSADAVLLGAIGGPVRLTLPSILYTRKSSQAHTNTRSVDRNTAPGPSARNKASSSSAKNSTPSATCAPATSPPTHSPPSPRSKSTYAAGSTSPSSAS